jgi:hypothetical protein
MPSRFRPLLTTLLVLLPLCAQAQSGLPPGVRGAAAPRNVAAYLDLERALVDALDAGNRDAAARLLADDFEVRSATTGSDAMPATDWLREELRTRAQAGLVREMSVREFEDIAIVTFLLDRRDVRSGKGAVTTLYVVDVWRQSSHRLLVRYVSRPSRFIPDPGRPSGRE